MRVKELIDELSNQNPESEVKLITVAGDFGIGSIESAPGYEIHIYADEDEA